jgi:hypothetical protein
LRVGIGYRVAESFPLHVGMAVDDQHVHKRLVERPALASLDVDQRTGAIGRTASLLPQAKPNKSLRVIKARPAARGHIFVDGYQ